MATSAFPGKLDQYNGVTIDPASLPVDLSEFTQRLEASLAEWKSLGRRGLWLRIPIDKAHLIPAAAGLGFTLHHAQQDYIMMTQWIGSDVNKIPRFASHYAGVGAVVINEKKEILVVTEKYADKPGRWKIPGGLVDDGEDLGAAACREAFEETGVKCEFVSILAFREKHNYLWSKSDLYFVCRLKPITQEINKEEQEITDCKWMPLKEFYELTGTYGTQKAISRLVTAIVQREEKGGEPKIAEFGWEEVPFPGGELLKFFRSSVAEGTPLGSPF